MPRPLKRLNPYASWSSLFGATVQRLRLDLRPDPVVTQEEFGRRIGFDGSTVSAVERAALRPHEQFVEACERELPGSGLLSRIYPLVAREWDDWAYSGDRSIASSVPPPSELAQDPLQLTDPERLADLMAEVDDAAELARAAESSHISSAALETLERKVDRFARDYPTMAPHLLIPKVQHQLRQIRHLLDGKLTLSQHHRLLVAGGWTTGLYSNLQFDVGNREAAQSARDVTYQLATEAGENELRAWTFEFLAWFALVDRRFRDSIEYSHAGLELSSGTSAGVQLAVQEARAWARLGDSLQAESALRRGSTAAAHLPEPSHAEHHYSFDPTKLSFYAMMIYTWLGEHEKTEEHAHEVIAQSIGPDNSVRWPTRLAIARLDLGIVAAQRKQPDEAGLLGVEALRTGRVVPSTLEWFADLDRELSPLSELPEVQDFREQYALARRSA